MRVKLAQVLLEQFHLLDDSANLDDRDMLMDLNNALVSAGLTIVEWQVIKAMYMSEPVAPMRDGNRGRPVGGSIKGELAVELFGEPTWGSKSIGMNSARYKFERNLESALQKIEDVLGYGDIYE
jgi:hypothetical protein